MVMNCVCCAVAGRADKPIAKAAAVISSFMIVSET